MCRETAAFNDLQKYIQAQTQQSGGWSDEEKSEVVRAVRGGKEWKRQSCISHHPS